MSRVSSQLASHDRYESGMVQSQYESRIVVRKNGAVRNTNKMMYSILSLHLLWEGPSTPANCTHFALLQAETFLCAVVVSLVPHSPAPPSAMIFDWLDYLPFLEPDYAMLL